MLAISLGISLVLLVVANYSARRSPPWDIGFWVANIFFSVGFLCVSFGTPVGLIQFLLLSMVWLGWRWLAKNPRHFLIASVLAVVSSYLQPTLAFLNRQHEYDDLRALYPVESLDRRLPPVNPSRNSQPPSAETMQRLASFEESLDPQNDRRSYHLSRIHAEKVREFIDSPGFGSMRMGNVRPNLQNLKPYEEFDRLVPQPSSPGDPSSLFDGRVALTLLPDASRFFSLHSGSIADFASPRGYGYQAGRHQSAGFLSHRFRKLPDPDNDVSIRRIELVGLLRHDTPVAYVTENLPAMEEVAKAPTRPLDAFETAAVAKLRTGDDVIVGEADAGLRMVGAIRLAKQCATCHDGNRGDLLGAFTYVLRPFAKVDGP